jgi:hypothetical protein
MPETEGGKKRDLNPEIASAAVVGFIGGVAVGRYLLDEIVGDEVIDESVSKIIYKCPKCSEELKMGSKYCSGCGVALDWQRR